MDKKSFTENEFTQFLDNRGHNLNEPLDIPLHCNLKIKPDDFFDFMEKEWMNSSVLPYEPRAILSKEANEQMRLANQFGYHTGNTIKRDWGKLDEHNETFKKLIGKENFELLDLDPDTCLVRLLCYLPGNIFPVHWDGFEGWAEKFDGWHLTPTRVSVMVSPWSWGHYLQVHDKMISNWIPGDTYIIPDKVLHCSGNGGVVPKVTLTITGLKEKE